MSTGIGPIYDTEAEGFGTQGRRRYKAKNLARLRYIRLTITLLLYPFERPILDWMHARHMRGVELLYANVFPEIAIPETPKESLALERERAWKELDAKQMVAAQLAAVNPYSTARMAERPYQEEAEKKNGPPKRVDPEEAIHLQRQYMQGYITLAHYREELEQLNLSVDEIERKVAQISSTRDQLAGQMRQRLTAQSTQNLTLN